MQHRFHAVWRLLRPRSRGQALVELALVLPVMLFLLLGAVDLGRVFYAQITITNASKEAALVAASTTGTFTAGQNCSASNTVMCAATNEDAGGFVTISPANVTATTCGADATFGSSAQVTVTAPFQLMTPIIGSIIGSQAIMLSSTSTAQCAVMPSTSVTVPASCSTLPTATIGFSQQNKNQPVVFTSGAQPSTGACAVNEFLWDFGQTVNGVESTSTEANPSYDYGAQGKTFTVTLTVTNMAGSTTVSANVTTMS